MALQKHELKALAIELAAAMPPPPQMVHVDERTIARLRDEAGAELSVAHGIIDVCIDHPDLQDSPEIRDALYGALRLVGEAKSKVDCIQVRAV